MWKSSRRRYQKRRKREDQKRRNIENPYTILKWDYSIKSEWHPKFKKTSSETKMKMFVTFEHFTFSLTYPPMIDSHNEMFTLKLLCNKFEDFIHFSMSCLLHTSKAFPHILFHHWKHYDAEVSVKMISESNLYIKSIHTFCEMRFAIIHFSEKFTLRHTTFFPTSSPTTRKHLSIERHFNFSRNISHFMKNKSKPPL